MDTERLELIRANRLIRQSSSSIFSRVRVRKLMGHLIRNRSLQLLRKSLSKKQYLNLGCGSNLFHDFINVDYGWSRGLDVCWDIKKGIPLKPSSIQGIFAEHALEHFTWKEAFKVFLPECYRILKPGGIIRISVPDAERCLEQYQEAKANGGTETPFRAHYDGGDRIPFTPMMHVNNTFRRIYEPLQVGHKFAYDFHTLDYFLHSAGFVNINRVAYMQGCDPMLLVDYSKRVSESLYVEAVKPSLSAV